MEKCTEIQISNCKQESGEVRNLTQERPLACQQGLCDTAPRHHSLEVPRPNTSIGASEEQWEGTTAASATQRQSPRQSQGQHLLQDERPSLLRRLSSPHRPHPFLIQQAEGKQKHAAGEKKVWRHTWTRGHCGAGKRQRVETEE